MSIQNPMARRPARKPPNSAGMRMTNTAAPQASGVNRCQPVHVLARTTATPAMTGPSARLDLEHDNMRAALQWACEQGDGATALRLAGALWAYWHQRGHLSEGRRWLGQAHALPASTSVSASVRVSALVGGATLALDQASYEEASTHADQAVAFARDHGEPSDVVAALNVAAVLAGEQARYGDSARDYQQALSLARDAQDRRGEAVALLGRAYGAMVAGDVPVATGLGEQAVALGRDLGDRQLLARALFLAAWKQVNAGAYEHAEALATEALGLLSSLGEARDRGEVLFLLGTVALLRGEHALPVSVLEESLALARMRDDERVVARDLGGLASGCSNWATSSRGEYERGAHLVGACEAVRRRSGVFVPPGYPAAHARALAKVREALTGDAFDSARALGEAPEPEETMAAILGA